MAATLDRTACYLRQRLLGSEAVYQVLREEGEIVTARVVHAPGLEPGMVVRLLARAARAMERIEGAEEPLASRIAATYDVAA